MISIFDSLSMVPLAVIPMTVALGGGRPWASAGAFVGGMYAAYFLCGAVFLMGADFVLEHLGAYLNRLWNQPNALELSLQIAIGLLLIVSALYMRRKKTTPKPTSGPPSAASPGAMFVFGSSLILVGIPGAVPYVAAIERIVRADVGWVGGMGLLLFYNLVFVFPFLCLMGLRYLMPRKAGRCFQVLADFAMMVMPRLVVWLFFIAGLVMVADGVGWFLGFPLLPVSPQAAA